MEFPVAVLGIGANGQTWWERGNEWSAHSAMHPHTEALQRTPAQQIILAQAAPSMHSPLQQGETAKTCIEHPEVSQSHGRQCQCMPVLGLRKIHLLMKAHSSAPPIPDLADLRLSHLACTCPTLTPCMAPIQHSQPRHTHMPGS